MRTMTPPPQTMKKSTPPIAQNPPQSRGAAPPPKVAPDRVRARAYELYLARNGNGRTGDAASDWLQAERELNGCAQGPCGCSDAALGAPPHDEGRPMAGA